MPKNYSCKICGVVANNACSLTKHIKRVHALSNNEYYDKFIDPTNDHICPICKLNKRKWHRNKYLATCGSFACRNGAIGKTNKVSQKNENTRKKYEDTCIQKYSVNNAFQAKSVKQKIHDIKKKKYGEDYKKLLISEAISKAWTEQARNKRELTNENKFGTKNYRSSKEWKELAKYYAAIRTTEERVKIANERRNTSLLKFGTEFPTQADVVKEKISAARYSRSKLENRPKFNDITFDSLLEKQIYEFCYTNHIAVRYHPCSLKYKDSFDKEHLYFPDFEIDGKLYEVKGKHLWKDGKLFCPFRKGLSVDELEKLDAVYQAKTNCMLKNGVKIIFGIDDFKNSNSINNRNGEYQ